MPHLDHLCQRAPFDDKAMRQVHAAIADHRITAAQALAWRARHLAEAASKPLLSTIETEHSKAAADILASDPSLGYERSGDRAASGGPRPRLAALEGPPGRWVPSGTRRELLASFLLRRRRHDWARLTRATHGGALFSDPLLLSMLRKVDPSEAPGCLSGLLLQSALLMDGASARCALALGADPLLEPPADFCRRFGSTRMNALGAALTRYAVNPLHPWPRHVGEFERRSDEPLAGACLILAACCPADEIPELLSLRARGSRAVPAICAIELAAALGNIHCARALHGLGADLNALPGHFPWDLPHATTERSLAFRELFALSQRADLLRAVPNPRMPGPSRPRI